MSYAKGRRFEWRVKDLLEARGWIVVRAARSKPVDLVAMKGGRILLIECKYDSSISKDRRRLLLELAEGAGAKPVLAKKRRYERGVKLIDLRDGGELSLEEL
ncbi:MAG: hypothetical protein B6U65_04250 [Candidatus Wolframiiraptor sp. EX4484-121]|nr:MAG: hypothetical protein B6U65_04250 [Candidatus Wolframiiraptor sp. EX4484-121]